MPEYGVYINEDDNLINTKDVVSIHLIDTRTVRYDLNRDGYMYPNTPGKTYDLRRKAQWDLNIGNYSEYSNKSIRIFSRVLITQFYNPVNKRTYAANEYGFLYNVALPEPSFEGSFMSLTSKKPCVFNNWDDPNIINCHFDFRRKEINSNTEVRFELTTTTFFTSKAYNPEPRGGWSEVIVDTYIEEELI